MPYSNPVHDASFADPFVLAVDGGFVAYGTGAVVDGRAFEVLRCDDLVHWEAVGGALEPLDEAWATDYWAPEVAAHDGRFYLYYPVGTGEEDHKLRVAVADAPEGPVVLPDRVIGPGHNSVVRLADGTDGIVYHAWDPARTRRRMCLDRLVWGPDGPEASGPSTDERPAPQP